MEIPDLIDALTEQGARLGDAAERAGPDTPVPTCPDWTVRGLVHHIGGVHRWATAHVRDAAPELIASDLEAIAGGWPPDDGLVRWFRAGHADLVTALRAAPADLRCATFLEAPTPLAMWARRQTHETTIHRIDAELASGATLPSLSPELAADGIDELLTCFITRPGRGPRHDPPYRMAVRPDDGTMSWTLNVSLQDVEVVRADAGPSAGSHAAPGGQSGARVAEDLTLRGRADRLYPLLWNRAEAASVTIAGDPALAERWRQDVQVRMR